MRGEVVGEFAEEFAEEFAGKVGVGAGNDSAGQSGVADDSHEKVGNGVGLTYRGVPEVENGVCGTQCPPRSSFVLNRSPNVESGARLGTRVCNSPATTGSRASGEDGRRIQF